MHLQRELNPNIYPTMEGSQVWSEWFEIMSARKQN